MFLVLSFVFGRAEGGPCKGDVAFLGVYQGFKGYPCFGQKAREKIPNTI